MPSFESTKVVTGYISTTTTDSVDAETRIRIRIRKSFMENLKSENPFG